MWSVEVWALWALYQMHWRIASIDRVGHGLVLERGEGQVGGHEKEKEAMGRRCLVPFAVQRCLGVWKESPTGDGARESGAKSGSVKSAATLGLPTYLPRLPDLPLVTPRTARRRSTQTTTY